MNRHIVISSFILKMKFFGCNAKLLFVKSIEGVWGVELRGLLNSGDFGVELKGFWCWIEGCVELRAFRHQLRDFGSWKRVALSCWTEGGMELRGNHLLWKMGALRNFGWLICVGHESSASALWPISAPKKWEIFLSGRIENFQNYDFLDRLNMSFCDTK